jgi:hypothetical protein
VDGVKLDRGNPDVTGRQILHGFRWFFFAGVAFLHLLSLLLFVRSGIDLFAGVLWWFQFFVLLAVSQLLSLLILVKRKTRLPRILLGVQVFALLVAAYPEAGNTGLVCLFLMIVEAELVFLIGSPKLTGAAFVILFYVLLCVHPLTAWYVTVRSQTFIDIVITGITGVFFRFSVFS